MLVKEVYLTPVCQSRVVWFRIFHQPGCLALLSNTYIGTGRFLEETLVRYQVVCYLIGTLLCFIALSLLVPLACALWWGEPTVVAFAVTVGLGLGAGMLLRGRTRTGSEEVTSREGFLAVTAVWLVGSFLGALPFWLSGGIPDGVDAWFETVSGLTTTGASILTNIEALPKSLLFWRSMTHWLGGLGIVVMVIAVLPSLGVGGLYLLRGEAGLTPERFTPRLVQTAQLLFGIYAALTGLETVLLLLCDMSLFDALTNTFGTIATGGFSPRNTSIAAYHSLSIELVIIVFMLLGGTNFGLYYRVLSGRWREAWSNPEWRLMVFVLSLATLLVAGDLLEAGSYTSVPQALREAAFQTVSVGTTTGFATADFAGWPSFSQGLLVVLMFVGASLGSTSGAIRLGRLILFGKLMAYQLRRLIRPRQVEVLTVDGTTVEREALAYVTAYVELYMGLAVAASLLLTGFGIDLVTSVSAVATTLGGVGPGLNLVGPMSNFSMLPVGAKLVLIGCMLVGRLELYTPLILCVPAFWRL
jgi:trk system potassium uptake protein TrkH